MRSSISYAILTLTFINLFISIAHFCLPSTSCPVSTAVSKTSSADFMSGDDNIGKSSGTDSKKGMDCVLGASEQKGKTKTKIKIVCRKSKTHSIGEESQENKSSVAFSISQNDSSVLDQRCSPVDEASPSSVTSFGPAPICRQFWKAGNYDMGEGSKSQLRSMMLSILQIYCLILLL